MNHLLPQSDLNTQLYSFYFTGTGVMNSRIYRQWPHENTKARSIRQMLHDLFQIRMLSRYGEDVEVPSSWFYLKTGQIIKGWLWDLKQEENDDLISILVERSENIARSSDLAYVHGSMIGAVIIDHADVNGFQLPPFTFERRKYGLEPTRNEVSRRAQELSKNLSEQINNKIHFRIDWEQVPEEAGSIAMVQELLSRLAGCLSVLASDSQLRSRIRNLDTVMIRTGSISDIQLLRTSIEASINVKEHEPPFFERGKLKETLKNLLGNK